MLVAGAGVRVAGRGVPAAAGGRGHHGGGRGGGGQRRRRHQRPAGPVAGARPLAPPRRALPPSAASRAASTPTMGSVSAHRRRRRLLLSSTSPYPPHIALSSPVLPTAVRMCWYCKASFPKQSSSSTLKLNSRAINLLAIVFESAGRGERARGVPSPSLLSSWLLLELIA